MLQDASCVFFSRRAVERPVQREIQLPVKRIASLQTHLAVATCTPAKRHRRAVTSHSTTAVTSGATQHRSGSRANHHPLAAARMLKQLFAPTKGNLLGWAAAAAVVGAWQYFTSGPDAVDDTLAYNQKIINENKKKP